ncbi:hypothetical protein WN982_29580 [Paraburkholderia sp. IMGN_8]|uniref:hypothetical protein n=1 Tax=Paraburkholderia sp. IMGN_8 TaxID=3136564 RepID=UPI0031011135
MASLKRSTDDVREITVANELSAFESVHQQMEGASRGIVPFHQAKSMGYRV